jgi:hypothetical protein
MTRYSRCDPGDDILDSRDVVERFEELESDLRQTYILSLEEGEDGEPIEDPPFDDWVEANTADPDVAEYLMYREFVAEGENYVTDWRHGATLISEHYFEDYARDLASDLYGKEVDEVRWPFTCIDWKQAARELQMDYSSIEFGDTTYYYTS